MTNQFNFKMEEESNEEIDREFKQILTTCSFCELVLDNMESVKKCKLLQCLHSICDNCVTYLSTSGTKETYCPKCTLPVNIDKLLEHKILEELIAYEEETNVTCAMHPSESVTHWCNNCLEYICEVCIKLHLQLKATKEHDIISKMEYLKFKENKQGNFPCKIHTSEQLTLLCMKCKQMTCRDCQLDLHRDHGHEFVGNAVVPAKKEILLTYIQLEHHKLVLDEAQKLIKERKNDINQRKQEIHTEINNFSQNLVNVIMKWTKNLLGNLDMVTTRQLSLYDSQAQSVEGITRPIIHTLKFVKKALKTSSDTSILYHKDLLLNRMTMLRGHKVLIPNSSQQTRIKFTYGNVNSLIKVLQSFGEVTVFNQLEDGTARSDEVCEKLNTSMAHMIKQQDERCKGPQPPKPSKQQKLEKEEAGNYGPQSVASSASPVTSQPYHPSPSYPSQHFLQQTVQQQPFPHHQLSQPQQQRSPYQQNPPGFVNNGNINYSEVRVNAVSQQIPSPQIKYSSQLYPAQLHSSQHSSPSCWPGSASIGTGLPDQRNTFVAATSHHSSLRPRPYELIQQQPQQQQQQHANPQLSSCIYQNVQYQTYPPYQRQHQQQQMFAYGPPRPPSSGPPKPPPGLQFQTSSASLHFSPASSLNTSERSLVQSSPQASVASWHTPQPRTVDTMSANSGGS